MKRILAASVVVGPLVLFLAMLVHVIVQARPLTALSSLREWFDPLLLIYNLLLLGFAVLFMPLIAISYIFCMKGEKQLRLRRELGTHWKEHEERVMAYIESQFRGRDYIVAVAAMMMVVAFGGWVLLIVKPVWSAGSGIDFSRGANLLLVGTHVANGYSADTFSIITYSLTAFAFGFLGAFIYSITQLVRSYFTTDLNAGTFVAGATRIAMASVLSLIVAFGISAMSIGPDQGPSPAANNNVMAMIGTVRPSHAAAAQILPLLAFFFGYFPNSAMRAIERITSRLLTWMVKDENWGATSLNKISGMNINHAFRMEREGFDNAENLAYADPVELAMRTGFPYPQVKSWIDEARLLIHLGDEDFRAFVAGTGIRTYDQLCLFVSRWDDARGSWSEHLSNVSRRDMAGKLDAIVRIAKAAERSPTRAAVIPIRSDSQPAIPVV